ncbi:PDZ domain-containing protein [Bremerella sp. JC817]|uniref:PDZ domain-containing protein n=1 Tax=Bremerella sp. JC817 TaxID=3231756 RepID=UPI0034588282
MRLLHSIRMSIALAAILIVTPQWVMAQGALDRLNNLIDRVQSNTLPPPLPPDQPTPATATVEKPFIGAMLDTAVSSSFPNGKDGIVVTEVNAGGPADKAGLKQGDQIMTIDGAVYSDLQSLGTWMQTKNPGDKVRMQVGRDGKTVGLDLVLGGQEVEVSDPPARPARPGGYDPLGVEGAMPPPVDTLPPPANEAPRVLGVRVVPLTEQIRQQTGVSVRRGAYVESVSRDGVADRANIPAGAVIVAYDGRRVDDAVELIQLVRNSPDNRAIPVSYYFGNRMETTQVYYGDPRQLPQSPGPQADNDRPALRMLQQAIGSVEGGNFASQEQVDSLSRRVRELEQEIRALREEMQTLKAGRDL